MLMKRNVLLLLNSFETGGAEGQLLLLARLLLESQHYSVHLACLRRTGRLLGEAEQLGVGDIPEFPLTSFYDWNMAVQLRRAAAGATTIFAAAIDAGNWWGFRIEGGQLAIESHTNNRVAARRISSTRRSSGARCPSRLSRSAKGRSRLRNALIRACRCCNDPS